MAAAHDRQPSLRRPLPGAGALARRDQVQPTQVVAAAGSAIVTAARVGRILGRSGWRIARQLPGGAMIEREAQRVQQAAIGELRRVLDRPQSVFGATTAEENRAVMLIQASRPDEAPLRSAMSELLERSVEADRASSQQYLFGTIMSQLVPDEARILAALSDREVFASGDVIIKPVARSSRTRVVLRNASTIGRAAGVASPENTPTYLSRLHGFGLVEFGPEDAALGTQYEILATDAGVQAAMHKGEARKAGPVRLRRTTVTLAPLGRQFWAASNPVGAPERPALR